MSQINPEMQSSDSPASQSVATANFHQAELEIASLGLISQLEMHVEKMGTNRNSKVESASESSNKLLTLLLDFSDSNLSEDAAAKSLKAIETASFASLAHKEAIDTLSWGFAISNLFGKSICSDEGVRTSYERLGEAVLTACVAVLRQVVAVVGFDSTHAETIEQSTAIFVEEFRANW